MPENLYPQLPTAPPISQESFNIEMVRKYYQDIANIKEKYTEKQRKYKNAYNRLLHASTGASSVALVSGVFTVWDVCWRADVFSLLSVLALHNTLIHTILIFIAPSFYTDVICNLVDFT